MSETMQVKRLAELAGVSVRTLHHYDAIGLLRPSGRTEAGYRWYRRQEVLRLQQILLRRAMGWSLEQIRASLDDPGFDRRAALIEQRAWLVERMKESERMIVAVDAAIAALDATPTQGEDDVNEEDLFSGFRPETYAAEADRRWGDTERWAVSKARTEHRSPEQWKAQQEEQAEILEAAAALDGRAPSQPEVQAVVARHREHVDRWFYPCDRTMHARLADLWEADPRYRAHMDRVADGATAVLIAGIRAASS